MYLRTWIRIQSVFQLVCGLVFWPWAIYNTLGLREKSHSVHMGLDFGIVLFLGLVGTWIGSWVIPWIWSWVNYHVESCVLSLVVS